MSNPFTGNVVADTTYFYANGVLKSDSLYNPATGSGVGHIEYDENAEWLDSLNKRRAAIIDYIRMRLGDGIVDVELDKEHYEMSIDKTGSRYVRIHFDWDYKRRKVHLSMPGYIQKALKQFQHLPPNKPQNQPHPHIPPKYRAKVQYTEPEDTLPKLSKEDK